MPRFMQHLCVASVILCSIETSAFAQAKPHEPMRHAPSEHAARDQNVVFDDDLLNADLSTPFGDPVFAGHLPPARVTLIRPRASFVPELYKSVEQI